MSVSPTNVGQDRRKRRLVPKLLMSHEELESYLEAWDDLTGSSASPNPFLQPMVLLPALRNLAIAGEVRVLLILDKDALDAAELTLCGLFPLQTLPLGGCALWDHSYQFDATPLVREDCFNQAIVALLEWVFDSGARYLRCPMFDVNSLVGRAFHAQALRLELAMHTSKNFHRAVFKPAESADVFLRANLSVSTRKNLLRLRRRLADQDELTLERLGADDKLDEWIGEFLNLEERGWKGELGTAMSMQRESAEFFRQMLTACHREGKLLMLRLKSGGRLVAMNTVLLTSHSGHYFKICFNEEFSAYSPGQLLELYFIELLHELPEIEWLDSCAKPNHDMIDRLWRERRNMQELWLGRPSVGGEMVVGSIAFGYAMKAAWTRFRQR